jgi:hypothetical protein
MAAVPAAVPIQVINVDLAVERQKILREKLRELFRAINKKSKAVRKEIVYTVNAENTELEAVLRANPEADALFTSFNYDSVASEAFKDQVLADRPVDDLEIDPQLRYPVIAEYQKLMARGLFRHRQIVLVGDLYDKLKRVLKSRLPLEVSYYTRDDRLEVSQFIPIKQIDKISPDGAGSAPEKIGLGQISAIRIGGIEFGGIVNMPEVANRFEIKDHSLIDTARKLYSLEGLKQVLVREHLLEEKLTFVRGKHVFMVLEADLDHVIAERLVFDKMQRLFRYHTVEEAEHALSTGKSQGIVEYFETNGYDVVFDQLTQEERDNFLLAVLGDRLWEFLEKEIHSQKPHLGLLEEGELQKIFYNIPEPVISQILEGLKGKSYEKYLALVPVKIRETVILDFLSKGNYAQSAWAGIGEEEKKEILNTQAAPILAHLNLVDRKLFIAKFSALKFEFADKLDAANVSALSKEEREAAFSLFRKSLERAQIPAGAILRALNPQQVERVMASYINAQPVEFYNRCNPLVRKQLWITVGKEYRDHIDDTLHFLDKIEILKGNKDAALEMLFSNKTFLEFLRKGDKPELPGSLFVALKRTNKVESKNALLKKLLASPEWKPNRLKGVPRLLSSPENYSIYQKLSDRVEGLDFVFDALICTKPVYERLKEREPLKNATVTLVDDLVDSSLMNLFQKGFVSKEEYNEFSRSVEDQIGSLRKKLAERESEDPLGVYILESMQILNSLANQAMAGQFDRAKVQELDTRRAVRQRLIDGLKAHLEKVQEFLERASQQMEDMAAKITQAEKLVAMQTKANEESYASAKALMEELQKFQQLQARAVSDKRKVALTQKELSLQFFQIIQPLVLEKIKKWPAPIESLLRLFRSKVSVPESLAKRVIFKFTDEEIERILRRKIVFCTRDEILMQFIVTCLNIDHLEDTLFRLATRETLPAEIDVLFYGPGYAAADFEDVVKQRRMVAFADEAFERRLLANEQLKARTKAVLAKVEQELAQKKAEVEAAGRDVKEKQSKLRQIENSRNTLTEERGKLEERIARQRERQHHFKGELEILETKFQEVDTRFDEVKTKVDQLVASHEGDTISLIQGGQNALGQSLRDDLVALNKELARMMFIKGVKDAGQLVSRTTQGGILSKMESAERFLAAKHPLKKMIVADDGSALARNIKRAFISVAAQYFKIGEMAVEDLSLKRLDGRAENASGDDYPFIAMMADHQEDMYAELRRLVRKVRNRMPNTYQLVFTPVGEVWKLAPDSEEFQNIRSLKENSVLVNASIVDYTQAPAVLRLLQEKAPLN